MAETTADEKLQLTLLDLLSEPKSVWDLLHDEELLGIDPQEIGQTLQTLHKQLRLKFMSQTLDGLFAAVQFNAQLLLRQLDPLREPDIEEKYWVQKDVE